MDMAVRWLVYFDSGYRDHG